MSLCQFLAGAGSGSLWGLYKSEKVKSVTVQVTGLDFFNGRRPVLRGIVSEGRILPEANDVPITLQLTPTPFVIPGYIRTLRTTRKVRWFTSLARLALQTLQVGLQIHEIRKREKLAGQGAGLEEDVEFA